MRWTTYWLVRKLRRGLCLLRGGHRDRWPIGSATAFILVCERCGRTLVIDHSDLRKPVRYTGIPRKRRVS